MTDDTPTTTDESTRDSQRNRDRAARDGGSAERDSGSAERDGDRAEHDGGTDRRVRRSRGRDSWSDAGLYERLQWVALVVLVLVAIATLFQFYTNVSRFIAIWASRKYEPAIQATFALAVLASSLAGIVALSRNLR